MYNNDPSSSERIRERMVVRGRGKRRPFKRDSFRVWGSGLRVQEENGIHCYLKGAWSAISRHRLVIELPSWQQSAAKVCHKGH